MNSIRRTAASGLSLCVLLAAGCVATPDLSRTVQIQRTTYGVAHITAPDYESLAYGVAYAQAEDNVCQTADQLVTIRGKRSRYFGADEPGLLGLRNLPNEQIDIFIRAHMNDAALADAQQLVSQDAQAIARGYVKGFNRFLEEHLAALPAACVGQPWVAPMSDAEYLRLQELTMVQLGIALMADAMAAAEPPTATSDVATPNADQVRAALERFRFNDPLLGSNGWAFGSAVTENERGLLLGNPHFPWQGPNRFWQMHLIVPGKLDVMGASIGNNAVVQIGFNRDVAWTHTVSTGKRFTLHELKLIPGDPTAYRIDGRVERMTAKQINYQALADDGTLTKRQHTVWLSRFGPIVSMPQAGLGWGDTYAYAVQDANTLNMRSADIWIGLDRAQSTADIRATLAKLGVPWVNTIAADRHGHALYADVSVVPDVDARLLQDCAPSPDAARLLQSEGLVIIDGSRSACNWHQDDRSPVPGWTPIERMPVVERQDWVQNSNDSFWLTNPAIQWPEFSPLVGPVNNRLSLRTRSGIASIQERLAGSDGIATDGKLDLPKLQAMIFANRNEAAELVLDDLLALCNEADAAATAPDRDACRVLTAWDRHDDLRSVGAPLFREWWRTASQIENVWEIGFNPEQATSTPAGLNTGDAEVRSKLLAALNDAVATLRDAGFALDAPLGELQSPAAKGELPGLHGGPEFEGLLNKIEAANRDALSKDGYKIVFGTSYIQTVTFGDTGPIAHGILTYGQSSNPASPNYYDQLSEFSSKSWPLLPFSAAEIAHTQLGETLQLVID
ncbi:MAG TPA: acylase [Woeseiaceae bacterium]|nr:acylase [Woeseiaceae bacterium]